MIILTFYKTIFNICTAFQYLLWRRRRDLPLWGQLKPSIHTSCAKAHSRSLGFCQFCGTPSSATGSGIPRIPLAGSRREVQISRSATKKGYLAVSFFVGGEGVTQTENTISANNKYRIFSYLVFPITRENLKIHRKYS